MSSRGAPRLTVGIGMVVALVALLPVAGLTVLSARSLQATGAQNREASQIELAADDLTSELKLLAGVTNEYYWASALLAVADLGVGPTVVNEVVGLDLTGEYVRSQRTVDEADREANTIGEDASTLTALRSRVLTGAIEMEEVAELYRSIRGRLEDDIRAGIDDLVRTTIGAPRAEDMVTAVLALELAGDLRAEVSNMAVGYFAVRFPSWLSPIDEVDDLVDASSAYAVDLVRLSELAPEASALQEGLASVEKDERISGFFALADVLIGDIFVNGLDQDPSARLAAVLADPAVEARVFVDSLYAVDRHVDLVDAAAKDVATAAGRVRADATAATRRTVVASIVLGLASALAVMVMARAIIKPLRRMSEVAEGMQRGELDQHVAETGPRELRSTALALNEAVDQLHLAERQAIALAQEDLENDVLLNPAPGRLGSSLQQAVQQLTTSLAEREEFQRRLAHEASHDGLTGLPNRSAAMQRLTQALARTKRTETDLAVLFIDLDGFKQINDVHGHAAGDHVLRQVAKRLINLTREGDSVARLGGDEFLVVAEPVEGVDDAMRLGERILEAIAEPTTIGTVELRPAASIGLALAGDSDLTADEMIRDADLAVYKAKAEGRRRLELCDETLRDRLAQWADLESALRVGIDKGELVLHYQAAVDAHSGNHVSLEALVRWNRPGHGLIEPDDFIPIAERSDLIIALDRWVLREAARQLALWTAHPVVGPLSVAVNLSARHLSAPSLPDDVLAPLMHHGVDPRRLVLEITETALLQDLEAIAAQLELLRSHGVRVAIDDFGTGYTSLAHLRRLPVDVLKIDRSFISNLGRADERSLVKLIVDTGHLLGVSVTAEGVETLAQADELVALGSDALQGYRFNRPMSASDLEHALSGDGPLERVAPESEGQ